MTHNAATSRQLVRICNLRLLNRADTILGHFSIGDYLARKVGESHQLIATLERVVKIASATSSRSGTTAKRPAPIIGAMIVADA